MTLWARDYLGHRLFQRRDIHNTEVLKDGYPPYPKESGVSSRLADILDYNFLYPPYPKNKRVKNVPFFENVVLTYRTVNVKSPVSIVPEQSRGQLSDFFKNIPPYP